MSIAQNREDSYQWLLRALGSYLDDQPSCRISLAELSDGYVVRMQCALHKLEWEVLHFSNEELKEQLRTLMEQKPQRPRPRHQGVWANFPNGHQDFFRALGYELDQDRATGILIDELEDGIVVTYNYPNEGGVWQKRMVKLGLPEIEEILNQAFERRGKPGPAPSRGDGAGGASSSV